MITIMKIPSLLLQNVVLATSYILKQSSSLSPPLTISRNNHILRHNRHHNLHHNHYYHHSSIIHQRTNRINHAVVSSSSVVCCWFSSSSSSSSSDRRSSIDNDSTGSSKSSISTRKNNNKSPSLLKGWVQDNDSGEWVWEEDDPSYASQPSPPSATATTSTTTTTTTTTTKDVVSSYLAKAVATPQLPSGIFRPKKSLGQNYLKDPNTVVKIIKAFHQDATTKTETTAYSRNDVNNNQQHQQKQNNSSNNNNKNKNTNNNIERIIELGPGAGALTDRLIDRYGTDIVQCIEIDERSINILKTKHPDINIIHSDILQINYPKLAASAVSTSASASASGIIDGTTKGKNDNVDENDETTNEQQQQQQQQEISRPLVVIGNLPYYITSQILFALADASHYGAVHSATVTMQWEVGQRMVAPIRTKDYGILSVVFQLYANVKCHFKIPPTVFYPQPKVDSALIGVHFLEPDLLRQRLAGVQPSHLRRIVTTSFQQRRKTVRNSLKKLAKEICNGDKEQAQALLDSKPLPLPTIVQNAIDDGGDGFAIKQQLPDDWATKRPEEFTPGQFVELTRIFFGPANPNEEELEAPLGDKVWRKLKHGKL